MIYTDIRFLPFSNCVFPIFVLHSNAVYIGGECGCGCIEGKSTVAQISGGPVIAGPSHANKTAHTKVAASGGHANQQAPSKRASSGADGDYQLVQHEVLYSLSAEYEVCIIVVSFEKMDYPNYYIRLLFLILG